MKDNKVIIMLLLVNVKMVVFFVLEYFILIKGKFIYFVFCLLEYVFFGYWV